MDHATSDTKNIQAAIDGASDGDVIELKARKLADEPSGPVTPYVLGDTLGAYTGVGTAKKVIVARDGVAIGAPFDFPSLFPAGNQVYRQPIHLNKAVTLLGDSDSNGDALTQIRHNKNRLAPFGTRDFAPILGYNKFATVMNIHFEDMASCSMFFMHPGRISNCTFVRCTGFAGVMWVDNRTTYAGFATGDFSDPYLTYMEDCKLIAPIQSPFIYSSGWVIRDCDIDSSTSFSNAGTAFVMQGGKCWGRLSVIPGTSLEGFGGNLVIDYCMDNRLEYNTVRNQQPFLVVQSFYNGICRNNKVCGNTSEWVYPDLNVEAASPVVLVTNPAAAPAIAALGVPEVSNIEISDNVFTGYDNALFVVSNPQGTTPVLVHDCLWTRNASVRGGYTRFNPEVILVSCSGILCVKNDYTESGAPGLAASDPWSGNTHYLFEECSDSLVFDSGGFPPGQGGASNHVTDVGVNNRIVGEPPSTTGATGVGQLYSASDFGPCES